MNTKKHERGKEFLCGFLRVYSWPPLFFFGVIVTSLLAQDAQMRQDGPYWVQTANEVAGTPQGKLLHVTTRGHVILRGSSGEQVTYKFEERVRARTRIEAHRLFGSLTTSVTSRNGMMGLVVAPLTNESVLTLLEVAVPKRIAGVILETQIGDVEAYDLDGSLQAVTQVGRIRCDRIRGNFEGRTGGGEIHLGKMGGAVRSLNGAGSIVVDNAAAEVYCRTAAGEIVVHDAAGPVTLATEGGNIQVDRAASTVEAHTAEGVIEISQAGGMVVADARGGSIQVGSAHGVKCESAAGPIRVKTLSGPLRVSTAMGTILAEVLAGARIEDASLSAGSGDVTVILPSNLALSVRARNDTGANPRIVSDFSEIRAKPLGFPRPGLVYEGSINGGGPLMSISTAGGIIYVRKLK
jgi:DUF4097 and DUF4098 domain-containing protein YvlB